MNLHENEIASVFRPSDKIKVLTALAPTLVFCILVFGYFVTYGSYQFLVEEDFGNFFDYQAMSMLEGRFDVPDFAIRGEAFVIDGRLYGYFGITPSLLRIPFILFDLAAGRMSRSLMVVYFVITLLCAFQILRLSIKTATDPKAEPPAWAIAVFILAVGLGSTILFLGSRSFTYHEAILCGIAFSASSSMFAMQWVAQPSKRWWIGAVFCAALTVHARPSVGLFSVTFVSAVAAWLWLKPWSGKLLSGRLPGLSAAEPRQTLVSIVVIVLSGIALLSFNAIGYLKFGTFEGAPLRYHVQVASNPERLANVADGNFYLANIPVNVDAYVTGRHFKIDSHFPYFFASELPEDDGRVDANRIDHSEPTVAIPYSMPALFVISVLGGICALVFVPQLRGLLIITWLSVLPMASALFAAVDISHRYTGDFVPFLVITSAIGLAALMSSIGRARALLILGVTTLVCLSIVISVALTMEYQDTIWGVDSSVKERYSVLKRSVDEFIGNSDQNGF